MQFPPPRPQGQQEYNHQYPTYGYGASIGANGGQSAAIMASAFPPAAAPINPYRMSYPPAPPTYGVLQQPLMTQTSFVGGGASCTEPGRSAPPESYTCHKCHKKGHWITECPGQGAGASAGARGRRHGSDQGQRGGKPGTGGVGDEDEEDAALGVSDEEAAEGDGPAPFSCEGCEKDFYDEARYQAHVAAHEKCAHPGCAFQASKRVVVAHYRVAHGKFKGNGYRVVTWEGSRFRILVGNNPQEVEQWREERRKNFPTKERQLLRPQQGRFGRKRPWERMGEGGGAGGEKGPDAKQVKQAEGAQGPLMGLVACYGSDEEESAEGGAPPAGEVPPQPQVGGAGAEGGAASRRSALHGVCRAFLRGQCHEAAQRCRYRHGPRRNGPLYCRYFSKPGGQCSHGESCRFVHDQDLKLDLEAFVAERKAARVSVQQASGQPGVNGSGEGATSLGEGAGGPAVKPPPPRPKPPKPRQPQEPTLLKRLLGLEKDKESQLVLEAIRFLARNNFLQAHA